MKAARGLVRAGRSFPECLAVTINNSLKINYLRVTKTPSEGVKIVSAPLCSSPEGLNMNKRKFWPLDFDPEGEIYDTLAWDLPGYRQQNAERQISRNAKVKIVVTRK